MIRKSLLTAFAILVVLFAFVSCSGNVEVEDRLGSITFGDDDSRLIGTIVKYSDSVEEMYWYYTAEKVDDGYTTGDTKGMLVSVSENGGQGLSGKTLYNDKGGFSYGLWDIELKGYKSSEDVENGVQKEDDSNGSYKPKYTATIKNLLINKGSTNASAEIKVGDGATTEILFGDIYFSVSSDETNITVDSSKNFTLTVTDTNTNGTVTVPTDGPTITAGGGVTKVTYSGLTYTPATTGADITGEHKLTFLLTQKLTPKDTTVADEIKIGVALYELKFEVKKGTTTTISGDMINTDNKGDVTINSVQDVPAIELSKALPVKSVTADKKYATVSTNTTFTYGDFEVTYPAGAVVSTSSEDLSSDETTSDTKLGIEYKDTTEPEGITIESSEASERYDLTLTASTETTGNNKNNELIIIKKNFGAGRKITAVYHGEDKLDKYSDLPESAGSDGKSKAATESYEYDSATGVMTLRLFHASNIFLISKQYVAKIDDVSYYSLSKAFTAASSGSTITLLRPITLSESLTVSKSVTLDMAGMLLTVGKNVNITVGEGGVLSVINCATDQSSFVDAEAKIGSSSSINGTYYYTSEAAAGASKDGDVIVLLEDVGSSESKPKTIHLEGSGKTLDMGEHVIYGSLDVGSSSSSDPKVGITIKGNIPKNYNVDSKIEKFEGGGFSKIAAVQIWKPSVTIESGLFISDNAVLWTQVQGVYDTNGNAVAESDTDVLTSLTVNGGTFVASNGTNPAICVLQDIGKTVINDGTFTSNNGVVFYIDRGDNKQISKIVVNGGTFTGGLLIQYEKGPHDGAQIEINGGTFTYGYEPDSEGNVISYLLESTSVAIADIPEGTLTIYGGTFSTDPSAIIPDVEGWDTTVKLNYVAEGYASTKNNDDTYTVAKCTSHDWKWVNSDDLTYSFVECSKCHTKDNSQIRDGITVYPETAQTLINSVNSGKVYFEKGTYGDLSLTHSRLVSSLSLGGVLIGDTTLSSDNTYNYYRSISNLELIGGEGVVLGSLKCISGHIYGETGAPVTDPIKNESTSSTSPSYYSHILIDGLTISGFKFTGGSIDFAAQIADSYVKNLTVDNCTFIKESTDNSTMSAIHLLSDVSGSNLFEDVKITNNTVTNYYQGLWGEAFENLTVTGNVISGTTHNAVAVQSSGSAFTGLIEIKGNTISDIKGENSKGERAIRFGNGTGATIVVSGNKFSGNVFDGDKQIVKSGVLSGSVYSFENNTLDGEEIVVVTLKDDVVSEGKVKVVESGDSSNTWILTVATN